MRVLDGGVVRYELDRSITSTSHETYSDLEEATGDRPSDVLARRLLATGSVARVHVFSNVVTVTLTGASESIEELSRIMRDLYIHYLPGVRPTPV